jgi:hypothetical protein
LVLVKESEDLSAFIFFDVDDEEVGEFSGEVDASAAFVVDAFAVVLSCEFIDYGHGVESSAVVGNSEADGFGVVAEVDVDMFVVVEFLEVGYVVFFLAIMIDECVEEGVVNEFFENEANVVELVNFVAAGGEVINDFLNSFAFTFFRAESFVEEHFRRVKEIL